MGPTESNFTSPLGFDMLAIHLCVCDSEEPHQRGESLCCLALVPQPRDTHPKDRGPCTLGVFLFTAGTPCVICGERTHEWSKDRSQWLIRTLCLGLEADRIENMWPSWILLVRFIGLKRLEHVKSLKLSLYNSTTQMLKSRQVIEDRKNPDG